MSITALSLLQRQVSSHPRARAIVCGSQSLTYQELDVRADQVALQLQAQGLEPGGLAAICLDRSPEFIITALAVWKAGAAYLPVDPNYPADRLAFMLQDAQPSVVVKNHELPEGFARGHSHPIDGLAYVIYTSGSTGKPNGVEVTHANLAQLIDWHLRTFHITPSDRGMFASSPGFDAAVWEVWPYLAAGASLYLPDDVTRRSPGLLRDWMLDNQITIGFAATPLAEAMLTLDWPPKTALRTLLTGADTLHRFPGRGLPFELVNNYGPTECTVLATSGIVPPETSSARQPSIGRPVSHAQLYILDSNRRPVQAGSEGEIYIGGAGVARGYRNRPELTAERFVANPFDNGASRLYRTGDLGRALPNGEIEFIGRTDEQIKIRGFRIELGEIACALDRHPAVRASAVAVRKTGVGDPHLIAYLVLGNQAVLTPKELQAFLGTQLPEHMIPPTFVALDALPMTVHGKVDRAQLPEPTEANTLRTAQVHERTPVEEQVSEVLAKLLGKRDVGPDDNFFLLGGHSMLGTQLIVRLRDLFGVDLSLWTLFANPTPAALASEIERLLIEGMDDMSEVERGELLDAQ